MTTIAKWTAALLFCGIGITVCHFFIDRPFAHFVHDTLRGFRPVFNAFAQLPDILGPMVVVCALLLGIRATLKRPLTKIQIAIVLSAFSLALSVVLKNWLKFAFGRTWPETWVQDNSSLIRDDVYGFNPFHGGPGFAAFPSGHMVAISAIISIFWILYPQLRWLGALCVVAVFIGQLGANYHFVSDLIAGGFIGFSTGLVTIELWECRCTT
jgi:membrane-associated phospholipid phosphatase